MDAAARPADRPPARPGQRGNSVVPGIRRTRNPGTRNHPVPGIVPAGGHGALPRMSFCRRGRSSHGISETYFWLCVSNGTAMRLAASRIILSGRQRRLLRQAVNQRVLRPLHFQRRGFAAHCCRVTKRNWTGTCCLGILWIVNGVIPQRIAEGWLIGTWNMLT